MGKDLAQDFPAARARFEEADRILQTSFSRLIWEGPAETLTRTENCQLALYVTSMAALAALQSELASKASKGVRHFLTPGAAAGLSLGEYTALAAAGAVSYEEGLRLVRLRGQAMEEAARRLPGTMASILGLDLEILEPICAEAGAQVANINAPGQIVISGSPETVKAASGKAQERGAKRVVPLEVAGAFHSRLMEPAAARLKQALETVSIRPAACPVLSNVTGSFHGEPDQIRSLLVDQLTRPVRWDGCVRTMADQGIRTFLEVGPGTVLKGLVRRIAPEAQVFSVGTVQQVREVAAQWGSTWG